MRAPPRPPRAPAPPRAASAAAAAAAALLLMLMSGAVATSEFEYADPDQAPSSSSLSSSEKKTGGEADPGPAELVHSTVDDATGLRTDTFVKPLGVLTPGEVMNTSPWGAKVRERAQSVRSGGGGGKVKHHHEKEYQKILYIYKYPKPPAEKGKAAWCSSV